MASKKPAKDKKKTKDKTAGPFRKPRADLYTMLLVLSLLSIVVSCVFLYLELETYQFKWKGGPLPASVVVPAAVPGGAPAPAPEAVPGPAPAAG